MIIRLAKLSDIPSCVPLSHVPEFVLVESTDENIAWYLSLYLDKGFLFVAELDKKIIGYMAAEETLGKVFWINLLVVNPDVRGKGIGRALMAHTEKYARDKGFRMIYLTAPSFNKKTIKFYETIGMERGKDLVEFTKDL